MQDVLPYHNTTKANVIGTEKREANRKSGKVARKKTRQ